ncbi:iron-siderophore ABC transporter substrate-binding protein [Paenibacillus sp. HB172176]|uniref:iron-siderophore ABC transporter substrate-binding protein n=1 Tax=Paenibacillus sp. HB172176 TaxID=2493690 RepID=UPI00143AC5CE|nr:iron-siderophore ABC transporter substrate-binding protein [Paenibacillus sp. HB172176]
MKIRKKLTMPILLSSFALMIVLAGCGGNNGNSNANSNSGTNTNAGTGASSSAAPETTSATSEESAKEQGDVQYPITIKHALGETVIESKPERVVTISWANQDIVLALGVVPVGFSEANYGVIDGSRLLPWTKAKLDELGTTEPNLFHDTDGLDFEAISDANPDVILAAYSGITQEEYDILTQIAPVVAYQTAPWVASWREQVLYDAMGMGMQAEGEQLIKDTENLIQEKLAAYPELKGKTAAFAYISPADLSSLSIYAPGDPRGDFLNELGMPFPDGLANLVTDSFYLQLSAENTDALNDTDIIVAYGDEKLLKALQADPLLGKVPAIQRGSVVFIEDNTPLAAAGNPNPLSIAYTLDEYLGLIGDAAKKVANE